MYDNVGGKIKGVAKYVAWIFIFISILVGFILMAVDGDLALTAVLIMIVGPILAWLSSLGLYGFGQLIENTDKLVRLHSVTNNDSIFEESKLESAEMKDRMELLKKWKDQGWISEDEYKTKLENLKGE